MKKYFFTLNDFSKDGGSTVRMYGILNALAVKDTKSEIVLYSNTKNFENFHPRIKHIYLGVLFSPLEKRLLQALLTLLPFPFVYKIFSNKLEQIYNKLRMLRNEEINKLIFFTYLDNSLAYLFYRKKKIPFYINDIHGVATIEFKYKEYSKLKDKIINMFKYYFAKNLDKKVFFWGEGFIFVSEAMKNYFISEYQFIKNKKLMIVKDGLNEKLCHEKIDLELLKSLKQKYQIEPFEKIILFVGRFKNLGGVLDLIEAFNLVLKKKDKVKLFLVGDGEDYEQAVSNVNKYTIQSDVIFAGTIPYCQLITYQALADILICPDKDHPYSQMVPHVKYFDALLSCKPVINGNFTAVKEINENEKLSVDFIPSNIEDLSNKILYSLDNLEKLNKKYSNNKNIVCSKFTYNNNVKDLI